MEGGPLSSDQSQTWKSHVTNVTVGHKTVDVTEASSIQRAVGESEKAGHKTGHAIHHSLYVCIKFYWTGQECYIYYISINCEISWADPGGTAIPGHPVTEVQQAPSTSLFSKNQFNSNP
jgi:hypothetical protein